MAAIRVAIAVSVFVAVSVAGAAHAASITVLANASQYAPGDTIELSITSVANESGQYNSIYMATLFDTAVLDLAGPGQSTQTLPASFFLGDLDDPPTSEANGIQISLFAGRFGFDIVPGTGISGTTRLIVDPGALPGFTTIDFGGSGEPGGDFVFENATAPSSIQIEIVPEPTTALLVIGGLLALAAPRRRRR